VVVISWSRYGVTLVSIGGSGGAIERNIFSWFSIQCVPELVSYNLIRTVHIGFTQPYDSFVAILPVVNPRPTICYDPLLSKIVHTIFPILEVKVKWSVIERS